MNIFNPKILEGKNFNSIMNFAESLKSKDLEGMINAHKVYNLTLDQIDKSFSNNDSHLRGLLNHSIWDIEKKLGWHNLYLSQAGQDKIIYDVFFRKCDPNGFFVDIGAYDGIEGSNTYFFEKKLNWNGILIEPSRTQFSKLKNNRSNKCINTAVSNEKETLEFIDVVEGYSQMSGLNQEYFRENYKLISSDIYSDTESYNIETSKFSDLIQEKNIDYLSIDIEGGELKLLKSIDFNFYKIKVLSVENNKPNEIIYHDILAKEGFVFFDYYGADEIYFNPNNLNEKVV
tara:strand:+ start:2384 stop:3244 length:861 start_codon:yes stop_codon:yes gene_type:complete